MERPSCDELADWRRSWAPAERHHLWQKISPSNLYVSNSASITSPVVEAFFAEHSSLRNITSLVSRYYAEALDNWSSRDFIIGVVMAENMAGLLDVALRMRPTVKSVVLVSGVGGRELKRRVVPRPPCHPGANPVIGSLGCVGARAGDPRRVAFLKMIEPCWWWLSWSSRHFSRLFEFR